jgi:photosystem II stability/assembly factor-like uncharacterized protein
MSYPPRPSGLPTVLALLGTFLVLFAAAVATAQPNQWRSAGPAGGDVRFVLAHPSDADTAFVISNRSEVFRTTDAGFSWAPITTALNPGAAMSLFALAIDAGSADTLYVVGGNDIFRTTDAGASWAPADTGLTIRPRTVLAHPANPGHLFTYDINGNVHRSTDGGISWAALGEIPDGSGFVLGLVIAPSDPAILYAWSRDGAYVSSDGGATWAQKNNGLLGFNGAAPSPQVFAVDPTDADRAFTIPSNSDLFVTEDRGKTWTRADTVSAVPNDFFNDLVIDPSDTDRLFLVTGNNRVMRSDDAGASWSPTSVGLHPAEAPQRLAISPTTPAVIYLASRGGGAYRSADSAATWSLRNQGLSAHEVRSVRLNPGLGELFATVFTGPDALFRSGDAGASWRRSADTITDISRFWDIGFDSADPLLGLLGGFGDVYRTTDGGDTWAATPIGVFGEFHRILFDPGATGVAYAMSTNNGVFRTTDGGLSWSARNNGLPNNGDVNPSDLAMVAARPEVLYSNSTFRDSSTDTSYYGLYKSVDGGANWAESNGGDLTADDFVNRIVTDPGDPDTVYALTRNALLRSTDAGASWTRLSGVSGNTLLVDPEASHVLYLGAFNSVLRSVDGGANWQPLPGMPRPYSVTALAFGDTGSGLLHAGTNGAGVHSIELATDLAVADSGSTDPVAVGQSFTLDLQLSNQGPLAAGSPQLSLDLPAAVGFVGATVSQGEGCTVDAGVVTCAVGALGDGATASLTLTLAAQSAGTVALRPALSARLSELSPNDNAVDIERILETDIDGDGVPQSLDDDDDGDGLADAADNCPAAANPDQADLDGDGLGNACDPDADGDGLGNDYETANRLDPLDPDDAMLDGDMDGLNNLEERDAGSDPNLADTDGDGRSDGDEVTRGSDPTLNEAAVLVPVMQLLN